ncbi:MULTISPECIES: LysR family transcriptional regulator [Rahnella]|uniref:LysR family transcriptional regulator n=1 Tax=Rahnella TaxID=34037 RepID=UPI0006F83D69|nr:LysR family transcriptional regulator [Rahnella rivi]KQN65476.1 hypothetical protein ASE99_17860 [Serratia sp. Leaf51]MBB6116222.1 DNA-binding transcriptional LysR family regulator [Rahnella inusitata]MBU9830360.1 LysR family transcriptional regulator [Rahnella rivi]THD48855.1 LysR family transcriptional regulator [Enterobacteriaceae bacterium ML5]
MVNKEFISNIQKMHGFDLNLLLVFEVVFTYKSVTKAAQVLNVSPSAISQSLTRLRDFFSDALFIRSGNGLDATKTAKDLHVHLNTNFNLQQLLGSLNDFSNVMAKKKIVIHATPYVALRLLPAIYTAVDNAGLNCEIVHISADLTENSAEDILTYRKADIVFDIKQNYSFATISKHLLSEKAVPICRKNHPRLGTTLSPEEMQFEKSTFLNVNSDGLKKTQADIQNYFSSRNFLFSSGSMFVNASIVETSDIVSFVPKWFADKFATSFNFKVLECLYEPEPVDFYMIYNKKSLDDSHFVELLEITDRCKESNVWNPAQ